MTRMRALLLLTVLAAPVWAQAGSPATQSAASRAVISVGPNVQVSRQFPKLPHYENLVAGDPDHLGRLLACSTVAHQDMAAQGNHCYASFDNGTSWSTVLEFDDGRRNSDPAMTYGRGDTVFYVNQHTPFQGEGGDNPANSMEIYRSTDGGKQWRRSATIPWIDRQAIVVDKTSGRFAGRIYVNAVSKGYYGAGGPASVLLYTSSDGGNSFATKVERRTVEGDGLLGASTSVVLSDGTLAFTTFLIKKGRSLNAFDEGNEYRGGNAELKLLTSTDGGVSLNPWVTISEVYLASQGAQFAQLAADPGSPFFGDRLYVVWPDAGSGRVEIRFAYSADKGRTWSGPITINDDRAPLASGRGPDHMLPAIAVNKAGVVLVAWYDRRDAPDNMGWRMRAAASLDGGVTFTPSAVVSDATNVYNDRTEWIQGAPGISGGGVRRGGAAMSRPISVGMSLNGFFLSGGDTSGLTVGADGTFYPVWSDNRTGVSQLWTAPVAVRGTVERNGAPELERLEDVTGKVSLEAQSTAFDRATGTLTLTARLKNTSRDTVRAPVRLRVTSLTSQLGVPAVVGAANGVTATGAIWDFDSTMPATGLLPDSAAAPRALVFRLTDVRPIREPAQSRGFTSGLVRFDIRVFAAR